MCPSNQADVKIIIHIFGELKGSFILLLKYNVVAAKHP